MIIEQSANPEQQIGESDFILSSHAYDLSEEEEIMSHKDSLNESRPSFTLELEPTESDTESPAL